MNTFETINLADSGLCYPECMANVDAFHAAISQNAVPRCQDLQDVALCSLAEAIDTGRALTVDDVIETKEVYESEHPFVCREVLFRVVSLQVPRLSSVVHYEVEVDPWSSPISNVLLLDSSLTFTVEHKCRYDSSTELWLAWGYRITLARYMRKSPWNCTVPPPSFALGWSLDSPAHWQKHPMPMLPTMRQTDATGLVLLVIMTRS